MIYHVLSKYHELSKKDKHHRFRSWEHCYSFFNKNHHNLDDENIFDQACLHLAFYLASWGMMRGGTFLLQKDYRIHQYFIESIVKDQQYHEIFSKNDDSIFEKEMYIGFDRMIDKTNKSFTENILHINGVQKSVEVTDRLASKILLGVFGIVPAYDRYLKDALKIFGINQQFNEKSLQELVDFYYMHGSEFKECEGIFASEGTPYTAMKLMDMFFWHIGFLMDHPLEHLEELSQIGVLAEEYKEKKLKTSPVAMLSRIDYKFEIPINSQASTDQIRKYLINRLNQARKDGYETIDLKSGEIHKELKLKDRLPSVCNAMISLDCFNLKIIKDTPSGKSSTKVVRYYLN